MAHGWGRPGINGANDWERPGMGEPTFRDEPTFRIEPEVQVGRRRIGVRPSSVRPSIERGLVWESHLQG